MSADAGALGGPSRRLADLPQVIDVPSPDGLFTGRQTRLARDLGSKPGERLLTAVRMALVNLHSMRV